MMESNPSVAIFPHDEKNVRLIDKGRVLALTANFVAEPLGESLAFWAGVLGQEWKVEFAPYNQTLSQLLDPTSLFSRNRAGVNVILIRFQDLLRFAPSEERAGPPRARRLERDVVELTAALKSYAGRGPSCLVFVCPDSRAAGEDDEWRTLTVRMQSLLKSGLEGFPGVSLMFPSEVESLYPVADYDDPYRDELGHIPYTPLYFAALGTAITRKVQSLLTPPYKVIVLDCDQTLWKGVCAEDGVEGLEIDPARMRLQEFMVQQQRSGMLLCLCSRNREEDIAEVFSRREMPLTREHIVSWRINWEPKSRNIRSLADELRLGLDSFIFIDDDPVVCAEVRAECPDVLTLPLPPDESRLPHFLDHVWAFDRASATREDATRTALYQQESQRRRSEEESASFEHFLAGLSLKIRISSLTPEQVARVAQLTQRTNQFNLSGRRRSEAELRDLEQVGLECLVVEVSDRFGDYGLVGVMIFEIRSDALTLDTLLLSCRALGRGVESRMLAALGQVAIERGRAWIEMPFHVTSRNEPIRTYLESLESASRGDSGPESILFRLEAKNASTVALAPAGSKSGTERAESPHSGSQTGSSRSAAETEIFNRIATQLAEPGDILRAIMSREFRSRSLEKTYVEPGSDAEQSLARMWSELLRVSPVGVEDDFFDLGGNSLQATLMISRVRDTFGTELSLPEFFNVPTISGLVRAIDEWEIQRGDRGQVAALLDELAGLSDEEVRAALVRAEQKLSESVGSPAQPVSTIRQ